MLIILSLRTNRPRLRCLPFDKHTLLVSRRQFSNDDRSLKTENRDEIGDLQL